MQIKLAELLRNRFSAPDGREFFNVSKKVNEQTWWTNIKMGIEAAQKVLTDIDDRDTRLEEVVNLLFGKDALTKLEAFQKELIAKKYGRIEMDLDKEGGLLVQVTHERAKVPVFEEAVEQQNEASESIGNLIDSIRPKTKPEGRNPEAVLQAVLDGKWSRKVVMLMAANRDINPHVAFGIFANLRKQPWMGMDFEANTVIQRARNLLAMRFLQSEAEWSFWMDSDVVVPFRDPAFFFDQKRLAADASFISPKHFDVMAVERMLSHQKTIVGGVYQMRTQGRQAKMVIQPHLHPRGKEDEQLVADMLAKGPQDKLVKVDYVATGCAIVHRSVYESIMKKFPDRMPKHAGEPFDFFGHDVGTGGEDIAFCKLASAAGHQSWLDAGLWCCHVGNYAFFPEKA